MIAYEIYVLSVENGSKLGFFMKMAINGYLIQVGIQELLLLVYRPIVV